MKQFLDGLSFSEWRKVNSEFDSFTVLVGRSTAKTQTFHFLRISKSVQVWRIPAQS